MPSSVHFLEKQMTLLNYFHPSTLLILFFIPFLINRLLRNNLKIRKNLPPSPPKLPIIGNLHQLGTYPHRSLQKLSKRYGPIMYLSLGSVPAIIISSAEGAQEIMQAQDLIFANRLESQIYKKLFYNQKDVSTAPYGEYWRQVRSICTQHILSKQRVLSFRAVREEETAMVMNIIKGDYCKYSKPVNLSEIFTSLTYNVVGKVVLGKTYDGGENGKKIGQLLHDFFSLIGPGTAGDYFPWLSWINQVNGINATADRVANEFDEFLEGMIKERLNHLEKQIPQAEDVVLNVESTGDDFVDILLRVYKDEKARNCLERDSIKAIILDMFVGGIDTTSSVIEWAMTELLRHPRILQKLQDEIRGIAKGKQYINEDDLESMQYLKSLIKETLRLYPPAATISPRRPTQNTEVMGYEIPAGSAVIINAWAIARDPSFWDNPEEFKPERFINSLIDYKGKDFNYIPFGSGRRGCPGISFSIVISELALANIVHMFNWKFPDGMKGEDMDMTECTGLIIRRKVPLFAIPTDSTNPE